MKNKQIYLDNWKGKSGIEVEKEGIVFVVKEYRKQKSDGEVKSMEHLIPLCNVEKMWNLICELLPVAPASVLHSKKLTDLQKKMFVLDYQQTIEELMRWNNFKWVTRDSFNGGRNRTKYYFPYYYYPVKILEYYKAILYSGRGRIMRISEEWYY